MLPPTPSAASTADAGPDTLREQHGTVRDLCVSLREVDTIGGILEILSSAESLLEGHFEWEEAPGGVFSSVLELAPQRSLQVADLRREHRLVISEIRELRRRLEGEVTQACARTRALASLIREHEARENELVAEARYQDIGGG